jgi:hypothetical protein
MTLITPHNAAAAVGLANSAFSAVKSAFELAKKATDLELKREITTAFDNVLELKMKVYDLAEENRSLRELLELKGSIKRDPKFGYWFKEGETEPICPKCYEGPSTAVRYLSPLVNVPGMIPHRKCNVCDLTYQERRNQM